MASLGTSTSSTGATAALAGDATPMVSTGIWFTITVHLPLCHLYRLSALVDIAMCLFYTQYTVNEDTNAVLFIMLIRFKVGPTNAGSYTCEAVYVDTNTPIDKDSVNVKVTAINCPGNVTITGKRTSRCIYAAVVFAVIRPVRNGSVDINYDFSVFKGIFLFSW